MSTDQMPALARATEVLNWLHATECECWQEDDGGVAEDCEQVRRERAAKVVSAALHDPDGALVEAVVPTLDNYWCGDHYDYQVTDDDGEPLQCCAKARLEQARRMFDALRAASLGEA